ncbi:MAG: hypothetical protein ACKOYM_07035 [Actinomycetes bacterium]
MILPGSAGDVTSSYLDTGGGMVPANITTSSLGGSDPVVGQACQSFPPYTVVDLTMAATGDLPFDYTRGVNWKNNPNEPNRCGFSSVSICRIVVVGRETTTIYPAYYPSDLGTLCALGSPFGIGNATSSPGNIKLDDSSIGQSIFSSGNGQACDSFPEGTVVTLTSFPSYTSTGFEWLGDFGALSCDSNPTPETCVVTITSGLRRIFPSLIF